MNDIIPRKFHFHFAVWGSWGIDGIKLGPGEIVIKDIYRKTIFCLEVTNLKLPDWKQVQNRHYEAWKADVIKIDTAGKSIEMAFAELSEKLGV